MRDALIISFGVILFFVSAVSADAPQADSVFASAQELSMDNKKGKYDSKNKKIIPSCSTRADFSDLSEDTLAQLQEVMNIYGCEKVEHLSKFEVYEDEDKPRALAGSRTLKLRADIFDRGEEFENILVHELAHVVDLGYLRGTPDAVESAFKDGSTAIYVNDSSVSFYQISWRDENTTKKGADYLDFVSEYAMTDVFEDFAETATYYVQHNREFRILAADNKFLAKKYAFMRDEVFDGEVFDTGENTVDTESRVWDTTKL